MKVELPGEIKSFADIETGECFAFTRKQVTSVCMKVEWLSSTSIAVLWSASDDWTVPHLIRAYRDGRQRLTCGRTGHRIPTGRPPTEPANIKAPA